jgi:tetratricopeptide (TPR) repeat protein
VDTRTRHALKKDKFAQAAASSASWVSGHRSSVVRWSIAGAVVVVLGIGAAIFWSVRSSAADKALGTALNAYNAPLAEPGEPPESGTYGTATERAQEANREFLAVAEQYGWLPEGEKARYFAGVTYEELGQNGSAEKDLKQVAGGWNWGSRNLSNLAKLALAGLYEQTGRNAQAEALYHELSVKPSETVPTTVAQLDLADLYATEGKREQARALWAKVEDADRDGAAGSIAAQKLAAK